ncbi:hypothetical protein Btru_034944 [Bulinus truncatus]|nr:hypothetical protein Btru_034944 [Bulinus truncatus]
MRLILDCRPTDLQDQVLQFSRILILDCPTLVTQASAILLASGVSQNAPGVSRPHNKPWAVLTDRKAILRYPSFSDRFLHAN